MKSHPTLFFMSVLVFFLSGCVTIVVQPPTSSDETKFDVITDIVLKKGGVCPRGYHGLVNGTMASHTDEHYTDVNTGIGGDTIGICAKMEELLLSSTKKILTGIEVAHWPHWKVRCPEGYVPARGNGGGKLTTRTKGRCWRQGLCVQWTPMNILKNNKRVKPLYVSDLFLEFGNKPRNLGLGWVRAGQDIHKNCGGNFVYLHARQSELSIERDDNTISAEISARELIEKFGPVLYTHPNEKYDLGNPEDILNHSRLHFGIVNESEWAPGGWDNETAYDKFSISHEHNIPNITADTLMDQVDGILNSVKPRAPYNNNPDFRYWIEYPERLNSGNKKRAKALVRILPLTSGGEQYTEIQFWFYYPFNGPGRTWYRIASGIGACNTKYIGVRVPCEESMARYGRHAGDWEHVSMLVRDSTKDLAMVAMAQHGHIQYFKCEAGICRNTEAPNEILQFDTSGHLKIYSAVNSHAIYNRENSKWITKRATSFDYKIGTVSADLIDRTKRGEAFKAWEPDNFKIIKSTLPGYPVRLPAWLAFGGRWGKHEKLKENVFKIEGWKVIGWYHIKYAYTQYGVGVGPRGPKFDSESVFKDQIANF